eukprot:CAMPEP_0170579192 /NCGR_PEP_ID=MMETSP0224-20130122/5856_1 /TAXON_ID=285029 /ORGANISM="Togula jolla, Strain CCCM 725" /LENGTH=213 /DNA_ID=CAMNT_0010902207 /DNA_START=97 /DNA_END=737 /DNA_ORIENTATION=+
MTSRGHTRQPPFGETPQPCCSALEETRSRGGLPKTGAMQPPLDPLLRRIAASASSDGAIVTPSAAAESQNAAMAASQRLANDSGRGSNHPEMGSDPLRPQSLGPLVVLAGLLVELSLGSQSGVIHAHLRGTERAHLYAESNRTQKSAACVVSAKAQHVFHCTWINQGQRYVHGRVRESPVDQAQLHQVQPEHRHDTMDRGKDSGGIERRGFEV